MKVLSGHRRTALLATAAMLSLGAAGLVQPASALDKLAAVSTETHAHGAAGSAAPPLVDLRGFRRICRARLRPAPPAE